MEKKKAVRIYNIVRIVALVIAAGTFTYASYSLTKTYLDYQEGDAVYEDVQDLFIQEADDGGSGSQGGSQSVNINDSEEKWVFDFDKLVAINPDARGYIKQDNSRINYPIMQGKNNDYYLHYTFNGTYNRNGSIFLDYEIEEGLNAQNAVVYGHNMWTNTMFGTLVKYKNKDYYEENPTFDVYVGSKHYIYYVFASFECNAVGDDVYQYRFATDEEFEAWQKKQRARSYYQVESVPELTADDYILTLSTCTTRDDKSKRVIVMCVRGEEMVDK